MAINDIKSCNNIFITIITTSLILHKSLKLVTELPLLPPAALLCVNISIDYAHTQGV